MGPLLGEAFMPMRDWNDDKKPTPIGMKIEFVLFGMLLIAGMFALVMSVSASAHPGGLAADGCHNDRKNGGRHCHRGVNAGQQETPRRDGQVYYANCAAARAAGAAPIRRGQSGYGTHLDRDGDGIACE